MPRPSRLHLAALAALLVAAAPPLDAGGLAIVTTELVDNGDGDGYADTNETVELWLTVRNTTSVPLAALVVEATFSGGRAICILDGSSAIGALAPGATLRASDPIVFHVATDSDRPGSGLGAYDTLAANVNLVAIASGPDPATHPSRVVFDLDLDVTPGGASASFFESFESGFGTFAIQNLDLGRHDDEDPELGLADGWRCQYNEAFCTHASCTGEFPACSPGMDAAAADATWWSVDAGRGYSGSHALYYGVPLGGSLGYTTPQGVMEASRTILPIHLDTQSVLAPTLSFKQQVSLLDTRTVGVPEAGTAADRAVVAVQLADALGNPAGPWVKIDPHTNVYDQEPAIYSNCTFDPVDDGSTGDDLFPGYTPFDGTLRRGPSSTCLPERVFAWIGQTIGDYWIQAVGGADGPGLEGASGPGTWIESRVDLSRFRGRSVRLRYLASSIRLGGPYPTWESAFMLNPDPGDDGWWIDDVTVTGARNAAGAVLVDATDNASLPEPPDADGDAWYDVCDGCPAISDPGQADADGDGIGNVCDACTDTDGDGFGNPGFPVSLCPPDNCPSVSNPAQTNSDSDAYGDACDRCPFVTDPDQDDSDFDNSGDACDCAPFDSATYPGAPETNDGEDNQCPGDADFGIVDELSGFLLFGVMPDPNVLTWPEQIGAWTYDVHWELRDVRLTPPAPGVWCARANTSETSYDTSATVPPSRWIAYYLVRPAAPNVGSLGRSSAGVQRVGVACTP